MLSVKRYTRLIPTESGCTCNRYLTVWPQKKKYSSIYRRMYLFIGIDRQIHTHLFFEHLQPQPQPMIWKNKLFFYHLKMSHFIWNQARSILVISDHFNYWPSASWTHWTLNNEPLSLNEERSTFNLPEKLVSLFFD